MLTLGDTANILPAPQYFQVWFDHPPFANPAYAPEHLLIVLPILNHLIY